MRVEKKTAGITIGFKIEGKETMIEVPLCKERHFMILSCTHIHEDGTVIFSRKMFETMGGRKHKIILSQRFQILKSKNSFVKPIFLHLYKDFVALKKAKVVKYINF